MPFFPHALLAAFLLTEPLPPLHDAYLLPPAFVCRDAVRFLDARIEWLECRQLVDRWRFWHYADLLGHARRARRVWRLAQTAANSAEQDRCRREALRDLLEALGPDAYYRGALPSPLPE